MIAIIDYGLGNLASIRNMLRRIEIDSVITNDPVVLAAADKLILPGVGAFDQGITNLQKSGLWELLNEVVLHEKKPILGICLGAQLLTEGSDEGKLPGLGWIQGQTVAFDRRRLSPTQRIPNMGWRYVETVRPHFLTTDLPFDSRFYFVHSFHFQCSDSEDAILTAKHGYEFTCGFARENVCGVQFHPEKSHRFGMSLLSKFARTQVEGRSDKQS